MRPPSRTRRVSGARHVCAPSLVAGRTAPTIRITVRAVHRRWTALRGLAAAAVGVLFALPLVFMVAGSLRPPGLPPPTSPQLLPDPLGFGSYGRAFELVDLGRYTLNSLLVVALVVPLTVLVASLAGFAVARLGGRAATVLVAISVVALMIPTTALIVPRFTMYRVLGVTDTYVPLVAPALIATSPLYVLLYALAFRRLPRELYDACALESLGPFGTWPRRPDCRPGRTRRYGAGRGPLIQ